MFRLLFLLFFIVPVVEIALFIQIGGVIGVIPTLALIALTALIGVALLRRQGLATLARIQEHLERGEIPALEMLEGMLLLLAGAFLLTPGFFTDTLGFLALTPSLRRVAALWLFTHADMIVTTRAGAGHRGGRVYEGEYRREGPGAGLPGPASDNTEKTDKKIPPRP